MNIITVKSGEHLGTKQTHDQHESSSSEKLRALRWKFIRMKHTLVAEQLNNSKIIASINICKVRALLRISCA